MIHALIESRELVEVDEEGEHQQEHPDERLTVWLFPVRGERKCQTGPDKVEFGVELCTAACRRSREGVVIDRKRAHPLTLDPRRTRPRI